MMLRSLSWLILTLLMAYSYALPWLGNGGLETGRPFVYRQFVPLTARLIRHLIELPFGASVVLVILLCAAGFALSARALYRSFHETN